MRIVLAEDVPAMRNTLADSLCDHGYEVVEVKDGLCLLTEMDSAFAESGAHAFVDLVITDVQMPGLTGLEVLEALRDSYWDTPVIIISAFADDDLRKQAIMLGAEAVLSKPFGMKELLEAVRNAAPVV